MYSKLIQKLQQPTGVALADQALVSGSSFALQLFLARQLGLEQYGVFAFVQTISMLLLQLQQNGIIAPLYSLYPQKQGAEARDFKRQLWSLGLMLTAVLALGIICLYPWLQQAAFDWLPAGLLAPGAYLIMCQLHDLGRKSAFAERRLRTIFKADSLQVALQLSLFALLWWQEALSLESGLWVMTASLFTGFLLSGQAGMLLYSGPRSWQLTQLRAIWQYNRWLLATAGLQWMSGNYYLVLASAWLGPAALGALRLCQNILGLGSVLLQVAENIVPVAAAQHLAQGGWKAARGYLLKVIRYGLALSFGFVLLVLLSAGDLLTRLFGVEASLAIPLFRAYAPLFVLITLGTVLRFALRTIGKNRPLFAGYALNSLLSLLLASWLIQQWEVRGVIMGLWLSQLVILLSLSIPLLRYNKREAGINLQAVSSSSTTTL